ncbi:MAG: hypothetical protein IH994_07130 [Proteobacteria bacterium]|nr:hypothetical protein [Pseudomonadota bacterium]
MERHQKHQWVFGLSFFAVLIGVPFVFFNVVSIFYNHKLDIEAPFPFWFVTWITALSVLLQFWVFCRWSGEGPDKVWKPVAILHGLIVPGMYGMVLISMFGIGIQISFPMEPFYWAWGVGSLFLSFWLPLTKSFAFVDVVNKQLLILVMPILIFLPEIFALVIVYGTFVTSGI